MAPEEQGLMAARIAFVGRLGSGVDYWDGEN